MHLAISVIRRCVAGDYVRLVEMILRDYDATPHRCHHNVREWVALHPNHNHVYGFFVANRQPLSDGTLVIAHSAVGDVDGTLRDITPHESDVRFPFVRHVGTLAEFDLIAEPAPHTIEIPNALLRELGVI